MTVAPFVALVLLAGPLDSTAAAEKFRALFAQGESLYEKGDYGAAIWNFRQADQLRATSEVAFDLAKCHEKLGDAAFAAYYYRLYLRRAPGATDALDVAERIGTALAQAESNGRGLLEVEASGATLGRVNGQEFAESPMAVFLPPGDYELTVGFPTGVRRQMVSIRTGKVTTLTVLPPAPPPSRASVEPPHPLTQSLRQDSRSATPTLRKVAYGTGALALASLATGLVLGSIAQSEAARAEVGRGLLSVSQGRSLVDASNTHAGWANVMFGVAGASALATGSLWVFSLPEPGKAGGHRR